MTTGKIRQLLGERIIEVIQTPKRTKFICKCPTIGCLGTTSVDKIKHVNNTCRQCANKRAKGKIYSELINKYREHITEIKVNKHGKPSYFFKCQSPGCNNITKPKRISLEKGEIFCRQCRNFHSKKRPYERTGLTH